jgi:hypothetical protein
VAIGGGTIVSGEGGTGGNPETAYVYTEPARGWANMAPTGELASPKGTGDTYFGDSVALSGHTVAVGDPRGPGPNDTVGITYTYYLP